MTKQVNIELQSMTRNTVLFIYNYLIISNLHSTPPRKTL